MGPHGWAKADRIDWALHQCIDYISYWEGFDPVPFHIYKVKALSSGGVGS